MKIDSRKVFYLIKSPLVKRDYDRFGIKHWLDHGWSVVVLDFTKILSPRLWAYIDRSKVQVNFEGLKILDNKKSALSDLKAIEGNPLFVNMLNSNYIERKIISIVKKKGTLLSLQFKGLPVKQDALTIDKIYKKIKNVLKDPKKLIQYVIEILKKYTITHPDYIVIGGSKSEESVTCNSAKIIYAHHPDYDFFLKKRNNEYQAPQGYKKNIVYIDGDNVYHSDFVSLGVPSNVTEEKFYPSVISALSMMSESLQMDVKVAAHPRAVYEKRTYKYPFPFLEDQTFALIQKASVVVSDGSTSLQWAVVMRKPIILITTNELQKSPYMPHLNGFSYELGKHIVNIDEIPHDYDWSPHLYIDNVKYQNYINKYIKQKGTKEKAVWDIVIDRMEVDFFTNEKCSTI